MATRRRSHRLGWLVIALWLTALPAFAGEWPQILGPGRNGAAENEKIVNALPAAGPKTAWQRDVGSGYSGLAVAGGRAVLFHRIGNEEIVEALDAATGKPIWKRAFPTDYVPSFTSDDGPRAVPLIHGDHIIVFGAKGGLHCLNAADGEAIWSRETFNDYSSRRPFRGEPPEGYFGIGSTPIVEGDRVLVNVGGDSKGAGIVAFALDDGRTLWTATNERASYSAPVATTIDGVRHVIFATRLSALSVDPANGQVRFQFPYGRPGPTVTAATPVVIGDHVLLSASYGVGAVYAKIGKNDVEQLWQTDELMSSQYATCVEDRGLLYGIHGRQDVGIAVLRCFDPATQKVCWTEEGFGYATLIKADGKLLIVTTTGELVLAAIDPKEYHELARAEVLTGETRALPALANGLLYVRDDRMLKCIDLHR